MTKKDSDLQKATFGAGCFWGVEDVFRKIKGVTETQVGYMGGHTKNPTYEDVCSHSTGHAEAVEVTFNPRMISYEELLAKFWTCHNPTQMNRQGPDIGSNYRSAIFTHGNDQMKAAKASQEALEKSRHWNKPIVTEITPATEFYRAEEYHQQYFEKTGQSSCHI